MEKRRRARINASLSELKSLLLEVLKKEVSSIHCAGFLFVADCHWAWVKVYVAVHVGVGATLVDSFQL